MCWTVASRPWSWGRRPRPGTGCAFGCVTDTCEACEACEACKACKACKPCEACAACVRACRLWCVRRQGPDARDVTWRMQHLPPSCPPVFRLEPFPAPLDQDGIGACAVNACAVALAFAMQEAGIVDFRPSRMFMYYNTRRHVAQSDDLSHDSGCTLRDACKAVGKFGACEESLWPYTKRLLGREPPRHLYHAARRLPPVTYSRVPQTLGSLVACLLHRRPVLMGMSVFASMWDAYRGGSMGMPRGDEAVLGAHAVVLCGFDLRAGRFRVQNCWGAGWGDRGTFELPMAFVLCPRFCWDLWTLNVGAKNKVASE